MRFVALPGFRDVFPDALARRRRIFGAWREVAARYGFEEYDGPPLESVELYAAKSGDEIVGQLYAFTDRGGREVALRPEMTPTLARMVGDRAAQLRKPIRWFSIPQLFRYERQQRGRLREHFQLNMDIIGEAGPGADAEVIAAAVDIVRKLGFGPEDVRVRLSDRRVMAAVLSEELDVGEERLPAVLAAMDRFDRAPDAAREAVAKALGADDERAARVIAFMGDAGRLSELEGHRAATPLRECVAALGAMGLGGFVDLDFRVVRGLAYYTGIVFELFDSGRSLRAICGGGRYDDLLRQLGGPDLPMVGFGMGDVVLGELLAEREGAATAPRPVDVFVASVTAEDQAAALAVSHALRERGLRVEYALHHVALRKQLELASSRGAAYAVILGPDERAAGEAVVRDLRTRQESRVALDSLRTSHAFGLEDPEE